MFVHPEIGRMLAEAHIADLRRKAQTLNDPTASIARRERPVLESIQLRWGACRVDLERLAALSGQKLGVGPWLVAEIEGELGAAVSLTSGRTLADPFRPTAELVSLLRLRARQVTSEGPWWRRPRTIARLAWH